MKSISNLGLSSRYTQEDPVYTHKFSNKRRRNPRSTSNPRRLTNDKTFSRHIRAHTKEFTNTLWTNPENLTVIDLNLSCFLPKQSTSQEEKQLKPSSELLKDYIKVRNITNFEAISEKKNSEFFQVFLYIKSSFSQFCSIICKNIIFESFIICVILANTLTLALDSVYYIPEVADYVFLIIYTLEASLKIASDGLILSKNAYLKDKWNILDLIIVVAGWVQSISVNLNAFRTLRILRPLRNISSIKGMKVIFMALIKASIPLLRIFGVLFFFILIFSITGLETMMGMFRYRCMDLNTGVFDSDKYRCGNEICEDGMVCAMSIDNPNKGISSFDNILYAFVMIFQCVTLQTWVYLMDIAVMAVSPWVMVFYVPLAFVGNFLLLNLTLAVIKSAFTKSIGKLRKKKEERFLEDEEVLDYSFEGEKYFIEDDRNKRRTITRAKLMTLKFEPMYQIRHATWSNPNRNPSENTILNLPNTHLSQILPSSSFQKRNILSQSISHFPPKKSKTTLIIPSAFELDNLGETELINFQKWASDLKPPQESLALHLFAHNAADLQNKYQNFSAVPTSHHLKSLQNSIKIKKGLIKDLKKSLNIDSIKILLSEFFQLFSSSHKDVKPELKGFEAIDHSLTYFYTFTYKGTNCKQFDELEEKWKNDAEVFKERYSEYYTNLNIFSYLKLKLGPYQAFNSIFGQTLERVKCIELADQLKGRVEGHWSGFDVDFDYKRQILYSHEMSSMSFTIWPAYPWSHLKKFQFLLLKMEESQKFSILMITCVLLNAFILSLEHYKMPIELENFLLRANFIFTLIFSFEISTKLLALGLRNFVRDTMNLVDTIVIILSWLDVGINFGSGAVNAFRVIRVFRVFRVARIVKIFRYLSFMKSLVQVISTSMSKCIYLALLLILLNTIYALLGHQIFGGGKHEELPRSNFENFAWSFLSVFQVLTLSSYADILYDNMKSDAGPFSALYVIIWIILGNFILLNLMIAILLDSFIEQSSELEKTLTIVPEKSALKRSRSLFNQNTEKLARKKEQEKLRILDAIHSNQSTKIEDISNLTIYEEISCEYSFFIFSKDSQLRFFMYNIMTSKVFSLLSLVGITLNCIVIIWETYTLDLHLSDTQVLICNYFQIIFAVFYLGEFFIKAVSLGFCEGKNAYIRDWWNALDFLLMIFTLIDSLLYLLNSNIGSVFKVLRAFRPLRFISKINSMKSLISALISSFNAIFNVIIVLFVIWFMFAILGVSLFAGKLYECENPLLETENECIQAGFKWINSEANFDNILEAFLTLFVVSLLELWNEIMYACIDARDVGLSPKRDNNISASYYFIFFIFIVSFYFLKLFMGVLFFKFHEAKKEEVSINNLFLSKRELFWINMQKFILKSGVRGDIVKEPANGCRKFCYKVVMSTGFNLFVAICINVNIIVLSMQYYDAPKEYLDVLDTVNIVFVGVFFIEICFKISAFGVKHYFSNTWNCFDCLVVVCGIIDISFSLNNILSNRFLRTGPQIIRTLRILRISRLLKVIKPLKTLNNLFKILFHSLSPLLNVLGFLLLFIFIFSIAGVYLFHTVHSGRILGHHQNFKNFFSAFLQLLYCSTLCEWPLYYYDCAHGVGKLKAGVFFVAYMSTTIFVIMNLFIMVVVQIYEDFESDPSSCLFIFTKSENRFKKIWEKFSVKYNGLRIYYKELPDFMFELGGHLGFDCDISYEQCIKTLASMDFCIENDGSVNYSELLYAVLKRKFGVDRPNDRIAQLILKSEESRTLHRLSCRFSLSFKKIGENEENLQEIRKKTKKMLAELIFIRKIFESWNKIVREMKLGMSESSEEEG